MNYRTYRTVGLLVALLLVSVAVPASLAVQPPTSETKRVDAFASVVEPQKFFSRLVLKANNDKYISAEGGGGSGLTVQAARSGPPGPSETFRVIDLGNNRIALQASNGQYVCAEGGGGRELVANRDRVGPWETFKVIHLATFRLIALQANNGQYVSAKDGEGVAANRDCIGPWESFTAFSW